MTVPGRPALRIGPASVVWRPRTVAVLVASAAALVLGVALTVGLGEYPIGIGQVLAVLAGGGAPGPRFVVLELRLPRALTGALVGGALAVSGALTQTAARNPLAGPDVIGFTAGASAAAVFVIVLGGGAVGVPLAALAGSLGAATAISLLARRGGVQGDRAVLIGVGINAILLALVDWMLVLARVHEAARAYTWLTGSLDGAGWTGAVLVGAALLALGPAALALAHVAGALQFGDDTARGLGIDAGRARVALVAVAVGLAAAATSVAGPIAFVALVAPQVAQRLVRAPRPPFGVSLLVGAVLTVLADVAARTVVGGVELPVGIVTAVLGAPCLLYLVARRRA